MTEKNSVPMLGMGNILVNPSFLFIVPLVLIAEPCGSFRLLTIAGCKDPGKSFAHFDYNVTREEFSFKFFISLKSHIFVEQMSGAGNNSARNAVNMNALLREINAARRANNNRNGAAAPAAPAPGMNPMAQPYYPPGLNPAAPAWNPPAPGMNPMAQPYYPPGLNPAAAPFVPEVPDAQRMNAYLREINQMRRANMPNNQRRRKNRKTRKNRKSRKASRRS